MMTLFIITLSIYKAPSSGGAFLFYTRHTSSCLCVGYARSPQSRTPVRSWGFTPLPPSCNSNYFGYSTSLNAADGTTNGRFAPFHPLALRAYS